MSLLHAAVRPAVAASDGELEKLTTYDDSVVPLSLETYGRRGYTSQRKLREEWMELDNIGSEEQEARRI